MQKKIIKIVVVCGMLLKAFWIYGSTPSTLVTASWDTDYGVTLYAMMTEPRTLTLDPNNQTTYDKVPSSTYSKISDELKAVISNVYKNIDKSVVMYPQEGSTLQPGGVLTKALLLMNNKFSPDLLFSVPSDADYIQVFPYDAKKQRQSVNGWPDTPVGKVTPNTAPLVGSLIQNGKNLTLGGVADIDFIFGGSGPLTSVSYGPLNSSLSYPGTATGSLTVMKSVTASTAASTYSFMSEASRYGEFLSANWYQVCANSLTRSSNSTTGTATYNGMKPINFAKEQLSDEDERYITYHLIPALNQLGLIVKPKVSIDETDVSLNSATLSASYNGWGNVIITGVNNNTNKTFGVFVGDDSDAPRIATISPGSNQVVFYGAVALNNVQKISSNDLVFIPDVGVNQQESDTPGSFRVSFKTGSTILDKVNKVRSDNSLASLKPGDAGIPNKKDPFLCVEISAKDLAANMIESSQKAGFQDLFCRNEFINLKQLSNPVFVVLKIENKSAIISGSKLATFDLNSAMKGIPVPMFYPSIERIEVIKNLTFTPLKLPARLSSVPYISAWFDFINIIVANLANGYTTRLLLPSDIESAIQASQKCLVVRGGSIFGNVNNPVAITNGHVVYAGVVPDSAIIGDIPTVNEVQSFFELKPNATNESVTTVKLKELVKNDSGIVSSCWKKFLNGVTFKLMNDKNSNVVLRLLHPENLSMTAGSLSNNDGLYFGLLSSPVVLSLPIQQSSKISTDSSLVLPVFKKVLAAGDSAQGQNFDIPIPVAKNPWGGVEGMCGLTVTPVPNKDDVQAGTKAFKAVGDINKASMIIKDPNWNAALLAQSPFLILDGSKTPAVGVGFDAQAFITYLSQAVSDPSAVVQSLPDAQPSKAAKKAKK